ncbi:hypothetical protein [Rhodoferax mekongensis]|uniref:hypothetical protein n=1 Tax=Rhodoferax mekongensis TaxID=3068341 RepID=UPI0028BF27F8|nr:hypothetical protein [Rhodoferax sp. TBRC 17199]MDT7516569.1 hypothetical protein [Rhodoferax sp. TBRC 17199]
MTGEEFQNRLNAAFVFEGANYGRVHLIHGTQDAYSQEVLQFSGHLALSDAFKAVFLEAVELMNTYCRPRVKAPLSEHYPQFLARLANAFHTLCGAECAAIRGYPRPAFTTLRNVFDDVVLVSASLQKVTDFYKIEGIDPNGKFDPAAAKKARKDEEFKVRKLMTGSDSGLSADVTSELSKLNDLFDFEVHGGRLSLTDAMAFMKGTGPLHVLPKFVPQTFAVFMNRFTEVGWAVHRLVPAIQPPGVSMPKEWADRWTLVDESFEIAVRSLSNELGMKVGDAYAEFIKVKFPFNAGAVFPL